MGLILFVCFLNRETRNPAKEMAKAAPNLSTKRFISLLCLVIIMTGFLLSLKIFNWKKILVKKPKSIVVVFFVGLHLQVQIKSKDKILMMGSNK